MLKTLIYDVFKLSTGTNVFFFFYIFRARLGCVCPAEGPRRQLRHPRQLSAVYHGQNAVAGPDRAPDHGQRGQPRRAGRVFAGRDSEVSGCKGELFSTVEMLKARYLRTYRVV